MSKLFRLVFMIDDSFDNKNILITSITNYLNNNTFFRAKKLALVADSGRNCISAYSTEAGTAGLSSQAWRFTALVHGPPLRKQVGDRILGPLK